MWHETLGRNFSKHVVVSMMFEQLAPWASLLVDFVILLVDVGVAWVICSKCAVLYVFLGLLDLLMLCAFCHELGYGACGSYFSWSLPCDYLINLDVAALELWFRRASNNSWRMTVVVLIPLICVQLHM